MHTHVLLRYRKICIWNAWGVLSHLPPNSHAENLRQIFILRPVSSLIQSKWMQQQTNLSNPTSKQPCSRSLWLKDTDIAEGRSEGGGEEAAVVKGKGGIVDSSECMIQPADFRKALSEEALWLQSWKLQTLFDQGEQIVAVRIMSYTSKHPSAVRIADVKG